MAGRFSKKGARAPITELVHPAYSRPDYSPGVGRRARPPAFPANDPPIYRPYERPPNRAPLPVERRLREQLADLVGPLLEDYVLPATPLGRVVRIVEDLGPPTFWPNDPYSNPDGWSPFWAPQGLRRVPNFNLAPYMTLKCRTSTTGDWLERFGSLANENNCGLALQAAPQAEHADTALQPGSMYGNFTYILMTQGCAVPGGCSAEQYRYTYQEVYWLQTGRTQANPLLTTPTMPRMVPRRYLYFPSPWTMPNPNFPPRLDPEPAPLRDPVLEPLLSSPVVHVIGPAFRGLPNNIGRREPPSAGQKERKMKAPLAALFHILDAISEGAEIVGAFYDALPKDVQKKWQCGKQSRGLIDNAGQYGIDGADCKLQALWHNWHKVDLEKAVRGVIFNELQDKVIGGIMARLPRNIGHAGTDDAMKQINKWLKQAAEAVGLL